VSWYLGRIRNRSNGFYENAAQRLEHLQIDGPDRLAAKVISRIKLIEGLILPLRLRIDALKDNYEGPFPRGFGPGNPFGAYDQIGA